MIYVLHTIYSLPFMLGAIVGLSLQRTYCHQKAVWLDRHNPLPEGRHHTAAPISRIWIAALAAVLSLGYVLLNAQTTHDQTIKLTQEVARCWQESYQSTRAQIKLNADNDLISRQQQGLQRQFDVATSDWLKSLVSPPGDLATQDTNSPARQQWGLKVTAIYQTKLDDLGRQFDDLVAQRNALDVERSQHKLPEVTCGK